MVSGCKIEFENGREPDQVVIPKQLSFCKKEEEIIDAELHKLLKKQVIEPAMHCPGEFISPIFIRPKKDGSYRLILNLKQLNESVEYHHFKMESVMSAIKLMKLGCFMASVDLKDAYYSVSVKECYRKFLRFLWKGKLFQYTALPKGLACCPRQFTKLLKPVYATVRRQGHTNVPYIDDSFLMGDTASECWSNVKDTVELVQRMGFIINSEKSCLIPNTMLVFLGFVLDSESMSVSLTKEKALRIRAACESLINKTTCTIRNLAQVIGLLVSSFPGVEHGPLYYRNLVNEKISALRASRGNFEAKCL